MGSDSGYPPFIQYNDLVGMEDGADTLCHNNYRGIFYFFMQGFPQNHIRFVVQRGKAVVKQENLRILGNGPGDGKTLLLSAGHVAAALGDRAFIPFRLAFDKLHSLRNIGRLLHHFIRNIGTAVLDIRSDITGEQVCLLRDKTQDTSQLMLGHFPDIHAVYGNLPFCYVIKPGDKMNERGFPAAGAADNRCGFARPCRKAGVLQGILLCSVIPEGNIFKGKLSFYR